MQLIIVKLILVKGKRDRLSKHQTCLGIGALFISVALLMMFLNVLFSITVPTFIVSVIMIAGIVLVIVYYQIEAEQRKR